MWQNTDAYSYLQKSPEKCLRAPEKLKKKEKEVYGGLPPAAPLFINFPISVEGLSGTLFTPPLTQPHEIFANLFVLISPFWHGTYNSNKTAILVFYLESNVRLFCHSCLWLRFHGVSKGITRMPACLRQRLHISIFPCLFWQTLGGFGRLMPSSNGFANLFSTEKIWVGKLTRGRADTLGVGASPSRWGTGDSITVSGSSQRGSRDLDRGSSDATGGGRIWALTITNYGG